MVTCACPCGYTGPQCATAVNFCSPNPCLSGGSCTSSQTQCTFSCQCLTGYVGTRFVILLMEVKKTFFNEIF